MNCPEELQRSQVFPCSTAKLVEQATQTFESF